MWTGLSVCQEGASDQLKVVIPSIEMDCWLVERTDPDPVVKERGVDWTGWNELCDVVKMEERALI